MTANPFEARWLELAGDTAEHRAQTIARSTPTDLIDAWDVLGDLIADVRDLRTLIVLEFVVRDVRHVTDSDGQRWRIRNNPPRIIR